MAGICSLRSSTAALRHLRAVNPPLLRLLQLVFTRSYAISSSSASAAAQQQLDHDYYYYSQNEETDSVSFHDRLRSAPVLDSEGSVPLRGVQWVFIGNPGARKHAYADKLAKLLGVPHISLTSLVRQDLSPRSALYKQIANAVNQGKLVPEEIIFGLLSKRLEDGYYKGETGFILNGIPRTQIQAEILDKLVHVDLVVNFKCTEDCLLKHHGDSIFAHSHQSVRFGGSFTASRDAASRKMQSRYSDGVAESARKGKPHLYAKQVKALEEYYKKQKKLIDFQVSSAPKDTWQGLLATLHLQHINAAHSGWI